MTNKIVLVDHHHEPPDNLVSTLLSDRGFALEWQRPFAGDTLEPPDTDMAGGGGVCGGAPTRVSFTTVVAGGGGGGVAGGGGGGRSLRSRRTTHDIDPQI